MTRINQKTAVGSMTICANFDAGNLTGRWEMKNSVISTGRLNHEERVRLAEAFKEPLYVVYSYSTPIAWRTLHDPEWQLVAQKFSSTTSRHLSVVKKAASYVKGGEHQ
jgi:hypothetical protein